VEISGKSEEECQAAFRISRGNSDLAYELLLHGIPEELLNGAGLPEGGDDGYGEEYGDEGGEGGFGGAEDLAALAQNPNFEAIRQRITQDPAFYQQFMDQLAQQ
jgi:hypothetical protein